MTMNKSLVLFLLCFVLSSEALAQNESSLTASQVKFLASRDQVANETTFSKQRLSQAITPCIAGMAGAYPCDNVDILSYMPEADLGPATILINDLWGWTDPNDGTEYALVGKANGTAFVDVSDPVNPVLIGTLASHNGTSSWWRDIKVFNNHAFIVSEASGHGMQVFNLAALAGVGSPPVAFSADARYSGFGSAHNLVMNEDTGFAYGVGTNTCAGGLHMVNVSSPLSPSGAGCFSSAGYTHDAQCLVYNGPDATYIGSEICINSNEDEVVIADVSNKSSVVNIGTASYPGADYVHQGWISADHRYFFQNDEGDEGGGTNTRTYIWDIQDLDDPQMVQTYSGPSQVIDHNIYIRDNLMYQANYKAGLRVVDIANPLSPTEVGFLDIFPSGENAQFDGAWSAYPYFPSGNILISNMGFATGTTGGLFVAYYQNSALPVELVDFNALFEDRSIRVSWKTLSETNNQGFSIEIAKDDGIFSERAFVQGKGNSSVETSYAFDLRDVDEGIYKIRLKQIDTDGKTSISEVIELEVELPSNQIIQSIFPNPFGPGIGASSSARIQFSVPSSQSVSVKLFDLMGQEIMEVYNGRTEASRLEEAVIGFSELSSGTYLVQVIGENFVETEKLVLVK